MADERPVELYFLVEDSPEGGYEGRALGYAIFTQADTMEEMRANIIDAVGVHFDEGEGPRLIRLHYVRDEVIATYV